MYKFPKLEPWLEHTGGRKELNIVEEVEELLLTPSPIPHSRIQEDKYHSVKFDQGDEDATVNYRN
jgi:hypothetical protein